MTRLADLVAGVAPAVPLPFRPEPPTGTPPDYCGCRKPPGCWGNGGIHFRTFGLLDVDREVTKALATLPDGSNDQAREHVERTTKAWGELYIGRHVAYEQCPAYFAAVKREIEERKMTQRQTGWKSDLVGEE